MRRLSSTFLTAVIGLLAVVAVRGAWQSRLTASGTASQFVVTQNPAPATVAPGGVLTYTVTTTNPSTATVTRIVTSPVVPTGLTYLPAQSNPHCALSSGVVYCRSDDNASGYSLAAGASKSFVVSYQVPASQACGSTITHSVAAQSLQTSPTPPSAVWSTVTTTVTCGASSSSPASSSAPASSAQSSTPTGAGELVLTQNSAPTTIAPGGMLTHTFTVSNIGTATATRIVFSPFVPTGLTYLPDQSTHACDLYNGVVYCRSEDHSTGFTLTAGQSKAFTISYSVPASQTCSSVITHSAVAQSLQTSPPPDVDTSNNYVSANTTVTCVASSSPASSSRSSLSSSRSSSSSLIPSSSFRSSSSSAAPSSSFRSSSSSIAPSSSSRSSSPPSSSVQSSSVSTGYPDLSVSQDATIPSVQQGGTVTYILTAHNIGSADALQVAATIQPITGLDYLPGQSDTACTELYGDNYVVCGIDASGNGFTLHPGESRSFHLSYTVSPSSCMPVTFYAGVASYPSDPDTSNNSVSVTTTVVCGSSSRSSSSRSSSTSSLPSVVIQSVSGPTTVIECHTQATVPPEWTIHASDAAGGQLTYAFRWDGGTGNPSAGEFHSNSMQPHAYCFDTGNNAIRTEHHTAQFFAKNSAGQIASKSLNITVSNDLSAYACLDSDGWNYYRNGTTRTLAYHGQEEETRMDECRDSQTLIEYTCDGDVIVPITHTCLLHCGGQWEDTNRSCESGVKVENMPAGNLRPGETYAIRWSYEGLTPPLDPVSIYLQHGTRRWLIADTPNSFLSNSYQWTIPQGLPIGDDYRIMLTDLRDTQVFTDRFTIRPDKYIWPVITNDSGGGFRPDDTIDVSWTSAGFTPNTKVNIVLLGIFGASYGGHGGEFYNIANNVPVTQGSYSFTLPGVAVKDVYKQYRIWIGEYPVRGWEQVGVPPIMKGGWLQYGNPVIGAPEGPEQPNCTGCPPIDACRDTWGEAYFKITDPLVSKVSPSDLLLSPKEKLTFTWSYDTHRTRNVSIILVRTSGNDWDPTYHNYELVASGIPSSAGQYQWTPSAELVSSLGGLCSDSSCVYRIYVGEYVPPAQSGEWNDIQASALAAEYAMFTTNVDRHPFRIMRDYIMSISPAAGEIRNVGETVNLYYSATHNYFMGYGMPDIVLVDMNRGTYKAIKRGNRMTSTEKVNLSDNGFYTWTIPQDVSPGDNAYRIWTGNLDDWFGRSVSDEGTWKSWGPDDVVEGPIWTKSGLFSIRGQSQGKDLRVYVNVIDGKMNISWNGGSGVGHVNVAILHGDFYSWFTYNVLASNMPNQGSYQWTIPDSIRNDCYYKVWVGEYQLPSSSGDWGYDKPSYICCTAALAQTAPYAKSDYLCLQHGSSPSASSSSSSTSASSTPASSSRQSSSPSPASSSLPASSSTRSSAASVGAGELTLTQDSPPTTVAPSGSLTYTITTRNTGTATVTNIVTGPVVPTGLTYLPTQSNPHCSLSSGVVYCRSDDNATGFTLTPGASKSFVVSYQVPASQACGSTITHSVATQSLEPSPPSAKWSFATTTVTCGASSSSAPVPVCHNGILESGEQCDDGNTANNDGCSATCVTEFCGDGIAQTNEQCDAGGGNSNVAPGACRSNCTLPRCGDGVMDPGEACDDGNTVNTDNCTTACALPSCGDSFVQAGEQCDYGNQNSNNGACLLSCMNASCRDGFIKTGVEQCDDHNATAGDGCSSTCSPETGWACLGEPSQCATACGDGMIAGNEICDDGNGTVGDGCSATCTVESGWTCTTSCQPQAAESHWFSFQSFFASIFSFFTGQPSAPVQVANICHSVCTRQQSSSSSAASSIASRPAGTDLAMSQDAPPMTVAPGATLTYTATVRNDGSSDATRVIVGALVPMGLTFLSAQSDPDCFLSGSIVYCWNTASRTGFTLRPGESRSFRLSYAVPSSQACSSSIVHVVITQGSPADQNTNNNYSRVTTQVGC